MDLPEKKRRFLVAGLELAQRQGFAGTTIDAILRASGQTKGSFFHYFHDRDDFAHQLLEYFWSLVRARLEEGAFWKETDPLARLNGYIDHTIAMYRDPVLSRGCLLAIYVHELEGRDAAVGRALDQRFGEWRAVVEGLLGEVARAHPEARLDVPGLAEHFMVLLEGGLLLARAKRDAEVVARNLERFRDTALAGVRQAVVAT